MLEAYSYSPGKGYAATVALYKDHLLIEGDDHQTLRAADEVSEYTGSDGEWTTGLWE